MYLQFIEVLVKFCVDYFLGGVWEFETKSQKKYFFTTPLRLIGIEGICDGVFVNYEGKTNLIITIQIYTHPLINLDVVRPCVCPSVTFFLPNELHKTFCVCQ